MLQALPHTALSHRLAKEGRLRDKSGNLNQTTLMNFIPTRPLEDIAREYVEAFCEVYDAEKYLDRTYRHFLMLGAPTANIPARVPSWIDLRALLTVVWRKESSAKLGGSSGIICSAFSDAILRFGIII
jgi:hypothetical protein